MNGLVNRLIRDKDSQIVIWQIPNAPLWTWIIAAILGHFVHGTVHSVISLIGTVAIVVWAVLEIGWGASLIRRLIGGVVLLVVGLSGIQKLIN